MVVYVTDVEQYWRDNYIRHVKTLVSRLDNNYAVAEEVVQEAFTKALDYIEAFKPDKQAFGGWFNTILNNCTRDAITAERNSGMSIDQIDEQLLGVEYNPLVNITKAEIEGSIKAMKEGVAKEVINLYFNQGMPPRYIVEALSLKSNGYVRFIISTWRAQVMEEYK